MKNKNLKDNILISIAGAFALFFVCASAPAQSLSFSRVILLPKNVNDTVPAGKVWKIESWTYDTEYGGGNYSNPVAISLNGITHYLKASLRDGNGISYSNDAEGPLWLPAATAVRALDPSGCIGALSIIEFTVSP